MMSLPGIALVYAPTRLEGLRRRWGTKGQAKFRLGRARAHEQVLRAGNVATNHTQRDRKQAHTLVRQEQIQQQALFEDYEQEDQLQHDVIDRLEDELQFGLPVKRVERS